MRFACSRRPLRRKVEEDNALVLEHAGGSRAQIPVQAFVVVEPPEGGPPKCDEAGASRTHPTEFLDRTSIIRGRSPIGAFAFQKRQRAAARNQRAAVPAVLPLVLIDENQRATCRDMRLEVLNRRI